MSRLSDYIGDMFATALSEHEVERILAGQVSEDAESSELISLIDELRSFRLKGPPADLQVISAELAAVARASHTSASTNPNRSPTSVRPRLIPTGGFAATAIAALILLFGISGVAVAANGSAPGHPLYGVDMFLENLGIGNGGENERMSEADVLMRSGDADAAFVHLARYLEQLDAEGDTEAIAKVERHIELAATKSNPSAAAAQEKVATLKAFIEANKGEGVGVDGAEFGQGVSEIARSNARLAEPDATEEDGPKEGKGSPPENVGPNEGKGNTPEHAGPKDK